MSAKVIRPAEWLPKVAMPRVTAGYALPGLVLVTLGGPGLGSRDVPLTPTSARALARWLNQLAKEADKLEATP